jgi:hypothetical protein
VGPVLTAGRDRGTVRVAPGDWPGTSSRSSRLGSATATDSSSCSAAEPRPSGGQVSPLWRDVYPAAAGPQQLADLTGTTIETAIRIVSRWNKEGVLRTDKDGFLLADRATLETLAGE